MAQPDAGSDVDASDRHGVLGGLALSSPDEAVSRGNAGEGCGGVNVWSGVSVGPNDAIASKSVADDGELAGRESDWDDVFVLIWAGSAGVSGDGAAATNGIEIFEYVAWSDCGNAHGGVHKLRGSDRARVVRCGNEHGVSAGSNVCFSGFECAGAGDDICIVSREGGVVKAGDGVVFDFCICAGGGVT